MDWAEFLQYSVTGLMVGMLYALIALGFVLVWKSSGVANLALGQLVLICSWFAYGMLVQVGLPVWTSLILVIIFALLLGWIIERFMLRPLIAQPILSLIAVTLGLAFILEGLVSFIWPKSVGDLPEIIPKTVVHIGPAVVRQDFIWSAGVSLLLFALLSLFFKFYKTGIAMRATADDQMAVQACGIPVTKIFSWSWMLACAMAAVGGILLSNIGDITYGLVHTGLRSFSVVILGGLDSFIGAIVSGPIIGLAESYGEGYLSHFIWKGIGEIIPFVIIIIVMFIRPYGLFGEERIERI